MRIIVSYPSGRRFIVNGRWHGPQRVLTQPNALGTAADGVAIEQDNGVMLLLDPRGEYVDAGTGQVLYRPDGQ